MKSVDKTTIQNYNKSMTDKHKLEEEPIKELVKEDAQEAEKIYFSHNNFFTAFFEEGGDILPTIAQQIRNEAKDETREEIAKKMIQKGMDLDTIIGITGISREKLEKIASTTH